MPKQTELTCYHLVAPELTETHDVLHAQVLAVAEQDMRELDRVVLFFRLQHVAAHEVVEAERLDERLRQGHLFHQVRVLAQARAHKPYDLLSQAQLLIHVLTVAVELEATASLLRLRPRACLQLENRAENLPPRLQPDAFALLKIS